ncbi:MAG: DUF1475 family protein [Acidobacteria bacterium]|nr:DUF1475 family protein [Acidobacteriota bacterium]MBK8315700.1 DUF1475 family protein [Acidobacteriota bacterium]MBK9708021.1 DUF1475 family protein [Acidobacteriota bacterium]
MKPIPTLRILFTLILIGMLWVTIKAGSVESVFSVGPRFWAEPWWIATLWDAYCGFITFYVWVFYKEVSWVQRVIWFVLVMCLGNIAMAGYMLIKLFRLPSDAVWADLWLRKSG